MKTVIASREGFYGGARVSPGQALDVPDNLQALWLIDLPPDNAPDKPRRTRRKAAGGADFFAGAENAESAQEEAAD